MKSKHLEIIKQINLRNKIYHYYHDILINHMCNSLYVTYIDHEMKDVVPSYRVFIDSIESRAIFNTAHIVQ